VYYRVLKKKLNPWRINTLLNYEETKAIPQHTYKGAGGRGSIAPTHS
jgi:hypothetical protein